MRAIPPLALCLRDASSGEYVPVSFRSLTLALGALTAIFVAAAPFLTKVKGHVQQFLSSFWSRVAMVVAQTQVPSVQKRPSTMSVLRNVRQAGALGLDVGGTLAKLVMAEPASSGLVVPDAFGEDGEDGEPEGRTHRSLDLVLRPRWGVADEERRLQFVSGSSDGLTELLGDAFGEHQVRVEPRVLGGTLWRSPYAGLPWCDTSPVPCLAGTPRAEGAAAPSRRAERTHQTRRRRVVWSIVQAVPSSDKLVGPGAPSPHISIRRRLLVPSLGLLSAFSRPSLAFSRLLSAFSRLLSAFSRPSHARAPPRAINVQRVGYRSCRPRCSARSRRPPITRAAEMAL